MFSQKGIIIIEKNDLDEDKVMEDALDCGASDFNAEEDVFEIQTEPEDFSSVRENLENKSYEFLSAEIEMVPSSYTLLSDEESKSKMQKLLDLLDDNDDVQNVFHNWENDD